MKSLDKITIILTVYNGYKFLNYSIGSLLAQSYTNLEIILINDGSVDKSMELISTIRDSRLIVVNQDNMGKCKSLNRALEIVTGNYIIFLDQDDYLPYYFIEDLYYTIIELNSDVVCSSIVNIWGYERFIEEINKDEKIVNGDTQQFVDMDEIFLKYLVTNEIGHSFWGKLFKVDLFKNFHFDTAYFLDDRPNLYKILLRTINVSINPNVRYYHLNHSDSMGFSNFSDMSYLSDLVRIDLHLINNIIPIIKSKIIKQKVFKVLNANVFKNKMRLLLIKKPPIISHRITLFGQFSLGTYLDFKILTLSLLFSIYALINDKFSHQILLKILFRKNSINIFDKF